MEFEPVGRYIRSQSVIRAKRPPSTVRFFQVSLNVALDKQFLFIFKSILKLAIHLEILCSLIHFKTFRMNLTLENEIAFLKIEK